MNRIITYIRISELCFVYPKNPGFVCSPVLPLAMTEYLANFFKVEHSVAIFFSPKVANTVLKYRRKSPANLVKLAIFWHFEAKITAKSPKIAKNTTEKGKFLCQMNKK